MIPASYTVPDAVANNVKALNAAYNASIAQAASDTGAALVDVHALFAQIAAAGGAPINPPKCCSLVYRGGLTSLDGLHPSNTGYALIANVFIQTIDAAFGLTIPQVNVAAVYATDPYAPGNGVSGFSQVPRGAVRTTLSRGAPLAARRRADRRGAERPGGRVPRGVGEGQQLHREHQGARDEGQRRAGPHVSLRLPQAALREDRHHRAGRVAGAARCGTAATRSADTRAVCSAASISTCRSTTVAPSICAAARSTDGSFENMAESVRDAASATNGEETLNGTAYDTVTVPYKDANGATKRVIFLSRTTHLPVRRVTYAGDAVVEAEDFSDVNTAANLKESDF